MKIFICLDEDGGMMFNGRRQSRDAFVARDIMECVGNDTLHIKKYSEPLFKAYENTAVVDAFTQGFCFIEDVDVAHFLAHTEILTVYKWNRRYPSDMKFTASISDFGFKLAKTEHFKGRSHEKITKETYIK